MITLHYYWMYVATPLFLLILALGLGILFSVGGATTASRDAVLQVLAQIKERGARPVGLVTSNPNPKNL